MYQPLLEALGLSPNEAKIYEALVERGELGVSDISVAAKVHRRNAYDAIERLIDKGLCFEIVATNENRYNAVDPDKLTEMLAEKERKLQEVLPSLKKKFGKRLAPEEAYIYRGYEGQKNIWREIMRVGKDVTIVGAKAQWFDPKLDLPRAAFYKEARKQDITFHLLLDHEIKTGWPQFPRTYPAKVKYRFLPKEYSTNSIIVIFGEYVVMYTGVGIGQMSDHTVFFIIRSRDLAESYRKWFDYMWAQSSK